jgi:repressor LexA
MRPITPRQQKILEFIRKHVRENGLPPTRAEIAQALGFRSVNAAVEHLQALARKGAIELLPGTSRGIRLVQPDRTGRAGTDRAAADAHAQRSSAGAASAADAANDPGLPLIGKVAAGSPLLAIEHVRAHYRIDPALFRLRADYLLEVRGLSMRDAGILEGDLLAVHRSAEARDGQIVVARVNDDVTVKRLVRKRGRIELHPDNPDFAPLLVDPQSDTFAIEGIAVGVIRALSGAR